jgi:hypothetical protein
MKPAPGELAIRVAARTVIAALLLAMTLQYLPRQDRGNFWLTGSLCVRSQPPSR